MQWNLDNAAYRTSYTKWYNQLAEILQEQGSHITHSMSSYCWRPCLVIVIRFNREENNGILKYLPRQHGQVCLLGLLAMVGCWMAGIQTFSFTPPVSKCYYITLSKTLYYTLSQTQSPHSVFANERPAQFHFSAQVCLYEYVSKHYCAVQIC